MELTCSVMYSSLFLLIGLMYTHGKVMQYTSSNFNQRVSDVHTISVATQVTAASCCALCSMTDQCASGSFLNVTGSCVLAKRNPKLDLYADTTSVAGWIAFFSSIAPCLPSWTLWESHCYFIQAADTFLASEASCLSLGGHLVDVQSQGEHDYLVSIADGEFWIGLNDMSTEGDFRWTVSNNAPTFERFSGSEPNDAGSGEDCVLVIVMYDGWFDSSCDNIIKSICKQLIYVL